MASAIDQIAKLIEKKTSSLPTKATIVRVDGSIVDITLGPGSGVIHHVLVYGDAESLVPGTAVPIQWAERSGGYLAPVVVAGGGGGSAAAAAPGGTVIGDNQTIEIIDGVVSVKDGGIDQGHLSFSPSMPGHAHTEYAPVSHTHTDLIGLWLANGNTLHDLHSNIVFDGDAGRGSMHQIEMPKQPGTPEYPTDANKVRVFIDSSGRLCTLNSANVVANFVTNASHTKEAHNALDIDADTLDGYHAEGLAKGLAKDVTLYVSTSGSDSSTNPRNPAAPYRTIQKAVDYFAGYACDNCKIIKN